MATSLTPVKGDFNKITKVTMTAGTQFEFTLPKSTDEYVVVIVEATGSGTVKVKAPVNGSYAAAASDLTLSVASGDVAAIRIESAKYANNKGLVNIEAPGKVAVLY